MKTVNLNKKRSLAYFLLIFSSVLLYFSVTVSKNLYTAEKTTLYALGNFGNLTNLASTMEYYFYSYAVAQILIIFFIKRINVKWFLTVTLGISAALTVLVAFTTGIGQHYLIFAVNGFLQAGIWGCLLKVLSAHLPSRLLPIANQVMAAGPAISGAGAYGIAAVFGDDWKTPFLVMGIVTVCAVVLYFASVSAVSKFPRELEMQHVVHSDGTEEDVSADDGNDFINLKNRRRIACYFVISMIMGFLFTSLYFMMNNNLDMYLKEIGGFSNSASKWLTVFAPVFAVVGPFACVRCCEKQKNFIIVCAAFFSLSLLFSFLLFFLFDKSVVLSLVIVVLFIVLVNGGRSVTLSIASMRMRSKIDTGVYSTLVNSVSSLASGLTPKIITAILDDSRYGTNESWRRSFLVILIWNTVVVVLLLGIIALVRYLNRRDAGENPA